MTETVTVRLDATEADVEEPAAVAAQIPLASTLPPGTRVVVQATATRRGGLLRRLLGPRREPVPRSTGCTALLARGYVAIGADADGSWGHAPSPSP
ncbi:MAG TPA: hypothetical protein VGL81_35950 [Polyangiaceae bacterium]|jgi:hypothetical protein